MVCLVILYKRGEESVEKEQDQIASGWKALLVDTALTDAEYRCYTLIVTLSYAQGYCFMSNRKLGESLGKSIRTVQRTIDSLNTKSYVRVHTYTDENGNTNRKIIPLAYVKNVRGHVKFDTGGMSNLSQTPCQKCHPNNTSIYNKMTICANQDLHASASSQKSERKKAGHTALDELFNQFWQAYPKKKSKIIAEEAFCKIKNLNDLFPVMIQALERQKASRQWQEDDGKYIPYPAKWLNERRWEDVEQVEVDPVAQGVRLTQAERERQDERRREESERRMNEALRRIEQQERAGA